MKWTTIVFLLLLLIPIRALGKTLTVAVIDTGIDRNVPKLCKVGHKSFTKGDSDPLDDQHGHGTHIAGLIAINAGDRNYCLVSLKFHGEKNTGQENLANMKAAIRYAIDIKVDFINISGGGPEFDEGEFLLLKEALSKKIVVVVAAGNEKTNLDFKCDYFPACYDGRLIVVGNLEITRDFRNLGPQWVFLAERAGMGHKIGTYETRRSPESNYGTWVNRWEVGTNVKSSLPHRRIGYMSGTSQATAVATGKLLRERFK